MPPERKRHDSEDAGPAPKKIIFEGQVLKLTKDGEPDMRFAVSRKFVAMQTSSMEKALGIHMILKKVFEHLPYSDLKKARRVNSFWNRTANPVFRKRSIIDCGRYELYNLYQFLSQDETSPPNNQELDQEQAPLPNQNLVAKLPFRSTVRVLCFNNFCPETFNRFLPFLLHLMPGLEEFRLLQNPIKLYRRPRYGYYDFGRLDQIIIPQVPADAQYSLTTIYISFDIARLIPNSSLDPGFLRHCPKLKTFKVYLGDAYRALLDFLESWKRIRSDSMQYENIEIGSHNWTIYNDISESLCQTLTDFINLNQCESLNLDCMWRRFDSGFPMPPNLWPLQVLSRLTGTSLRHLKLTLTHKSNGDFDPVSASALPLLTLTNNPAFSKVTDLTLVGGYVCHEDLRVEQIKMLQLKGVFATLGMLKGLRKLKLTLYRGIDTLIDSQRTLVALFNGYEPRVELEMKQLPRRAGFDGERGSRKWTFTVEQFKEALKAAETLLLTDP